MSTPHPSPASDDGAPAATLTALRMQILCGTDFSPNAVQATEAAAALARRLREPLVLAHIVDEPARETLPAEVRQSLGIFERARLREETDRLQSAGTEVREAFLAGRPEAELVELTEHPESRLIVLSSLGRRPPARWFLGSVAERVAEASPVPTLIVRVAEPFVAWAAGQRSLRVFVAADFSAASDAALRWAAWLRSVAPCEMVVAYFESVLPEPALLTPAPTTAIAELLARTERFQHRSFRRHIREMLGPARIRVRLEKGWGRSDAHLIQMARDERADLLVVGTHQRHGTGRLGHHSVSRGVLHYAPMNVACIPVRPAPEEPLHEDRLHRA